MTETESRAREPWYRRLRHLPVFQQHLLVMSVILALSVLAVSVSTSLATRVLTARYLSELQENFDHDCDQLSESLFRTYNIPVALKSSKYFDEMSRIRPDTPEKDSVLPLDKMRSALVSQVYLSGDSVERLAYFPNADSICTTGRVFFSARDCFDSYITFSETDTDTLLAALNRPLSEREASGNAFTVFPAQQVTVDGVSYRALALVACPSETKVSVLSLYEEKTLLSRLGLGSLPDGTALRLTRGEQELLALLPDGETDEADYYVLRSSLRLLGVQAALYFPRDSLTETLRPARVMGFLFIAATLLIGLLLCFLLSDVSTKGIRELARIHAPQEDASGRKRVNEVEYLARVIDRSKQQADTLQETLRSSMLARAFSGAVLSAADELRLRMSCEPIADVCRVALIHAPRQITFALKESALPEAISFPFYCEPLSEKTSGVLMPADDESVRQLTQALTDLNAGLTGEDGQITCGVSGALSNLSGFHVAVRQAHIALQNGATVSVFTADGVIKESDEDGVPWLQHERLYQSILTNSEEDAERLIRSFTRRGNMREAFYNVHFILYSASRELGLDIPELEDAEYDPALLPRENSERLEAWMHLMFLRIREREPDCESDLPQILNFIRSGCSDPNLCAATVAERFSLSEKNVYSLVRKGTGMSFREYLLSLRMRRAGELLCSSQDGIAEIARKCGCPAESTFYRVFKNYYNITPTQYRQDGAPPDEV